MAKRRIAVEAVVLDGRGRVLLVRQNANGKKVRKGRGRRGWELPGGHVKKGESPVDAVVREVREETGLRVAARRLLGAYYIPAEEFYDFVFLCRLKGSRRAEKPRPDYREVSDASFWPADALPEPIRAFTMDRVRDAARGTSQLLPVTLKPSQWLG